MCVEATTTAMEHYESKAQKALEELNGAFGNNSELEKPDVVLLMDGWNKILGWETMWKEALWFRWRILVARRALAEQRERREEGSNGGGTEINKEARQLVERNEDPLAAVFEQRRMDAKNLLLALFDDQVRSLCPHLQVVQREAYRPVKDDRAAALGMTLTECHSAKDVVRLFSTLGVAPAHYVTLCEAFLWTMESHNPYIGDEDAEDLEKPKKESAYARFVAEHVARYGIRDGTALRRKYAAEIYQILPEFWAWIKHENDDFGETFYTNLLSSFPELLDYFARADMDSLAGHILLAIDLMTKYPDVAGEANSSFRTVVKHLGDVHRELGIPTDSYPSVGMNLIASLKKFTEPFCKNHPSNKNCNGNPRLTPKDINDAFVDIYGETMRFTFYPMLMEEQIVQKATEFFEQVAEELEWSPSQLSKRLLEVKLEISSTGTYQHTSEEIELGARLSWRNSVKCIGRISWNTLMVRDCRHVDTPEGIVHEIEKHLQLATAGTNLQSVMTVFRPKKPDEPWGIKFWSDQLVRYACYELEDGTFVGDLANKGLTKYLIEKKLWVPPVPRTQHDVLPVVFKMPNRDQPFVHQFDKKFVDEADIFHPKYPKVAKLRHKWASVPAINVFNMNLGGVDYGCTPFNGWFCSVEIVRDLMERYQGASEKWAAAIGINPKTHRMWKARVAHEMDVAILHSFDKAGYTIVDPETVGEQFMTHCKRERDSGRECPAQWSWIGGLTGPINKTWHKEMRDFRKEPQYEYCAAQWEVCGYADAAVEGERQVKKSSSDVGLASDSDSEEEEFTIPRVLIAFGSETGAAEAAAGRLGRALRSVKPLVMSLNKVCGLEIVKKRKITHLLVLCSTFGKGQPPSSASKFFETKIPDGLLKNTHIATLALGSSMYPDFCAAGKKLDKLLSSAGGQKLAPIMLADEAVDSSGTVASWLHLMKNLVCPDSLEYAIEERMGAASEPLRYAIKWQRNGESLDMIKPFQWPEEQSALCTINEELLVGGDVNKRSTRRIGFQLPPGMSYTTGDHLCVNPLNRIEMVERFGACFALEFAAVQTSKVFSDVEDLVGWQLQQPFEVDCLDNGQEYPAQLCFSTPTTLGEVLQTSINLSLSDSGVADVLGVVQEYLNFECDDPVLQQFKELSADIMDGKEGEGHQEVVDSFLSMFPTVVDLLEAIVPRISKYGQKPIELGHLLSILPRLQPRLYSISSSGSKSPDIVEVSVGVVHAVTDDGVKIAGVCSNYLARLKPGRDRARISIRTSSFRGPEDPVNTPMILVGAGTGLAPMMGFLQDRADGCEKARKNGGNNAHLFFGCRTHDERMYRGVIEKWEKKKVLNLHLALSRDSKLPKMYVQDMIKQNGKLVCDLILKNDQCRYYVCGDARMSDFCYEAVVDALREHGRMSRAKATQLLKRLRVEDRWQYDLWGISAYMDEGSSYSDAKRKVAKSKGNRALNWLSKMKHEDEDEW